LSFASTCAVRGDGNVFCWGQNAYGQLGDGDLLSQSAPVPVRSLEDGDALGKQRSLISTSASFACSFSTTRYRWECWGTTWPGQLALDTPDQERRLMAAGTGLPDNVNKVAFGDQHGCAIYEHDVPEIYCFGEGSQVGRGDDAPERQLGALPVLWPSL
jgi:alpha-tubulin suppressor-like RCC1 family protein